MAVRVMEKLRCALAYQSGRLSATEHFSDKYPEEVLNEALEYAGLSTAQPAGAGEE